MKLLLKIALIALPVLLLMVSVSYIADPALILRDGEYERIAADSLREGKNIGLNGNCNERRLQRYFINGQKSAFDSIVLGSSRAMLIPGEVFGGDNVFNNGVTGATVEDLIGIISLYDARSILPERVFISIDPWLFNESHSDTRYKELTDEFNNISEKLNIKPLPNTLAQEGWFSKVSLALDPSYFQASLKNLNNRPVKPIVTDQTETDFLTKLCDGSVVYPQEFMNRTNAQKEAEIKVLIAEDNIYHSGDYIVLSPVIITRFAGLINYLESEGVEIFFILCPLHPKLYEFTCSDPRYAMFGETEDFIREFASDRSIKTVGSFNPEAVGASEDDFYDAYHPTRGYLVRLLRFGVWSYS